MREGERGGKKKERTSERDKWKIKEMGRGVREKEEGQNQREGMRRTREVGQEREKVRKLKRVVRTGTLRCPMARSRGLSPLRSTRSRLAPRSSSSSASSGGAPHASASAVRPLPSACSAPPPHHPLARSALSRRDPARIRFSGSPMDAPLSSRSIAVEIRDRRHAQPSAGMPSASTASGSAPTNDEEKSSAVPGN